MFLYSKWTSLPLSTRVKIAEEFHIEKKGPTEVFNNEIKSDGYSLKDIENILTLKAIQDYLDVDETDHEILFGYLIDKVEGRAIKQKEKITILPQEDVVSANKTYEERTGKVAPIPEIVKKKIGRPRKEKNIDDIIKQTNG